MDKSERVGKKNPNKQTKTKPPHTNVCNGCNGEWRQKPAGTPSQAAGGERPLCSAPRLAEVRPPCSPPDPGQCRLLRRVQLGLAASSNPGQSSTPAHRSQGRQPLPTGPGRAGIPPVALWVPSLPAVNGLLGLLLSCGFGESRDRNPARAMLGNGSGEAGLMVF